MRSGILTKTWERRIEAVSTRWWSWLLVAVLVFGAVGGLSTVWRWVSPSESPDLVTPGRQIANQNALVGSFASEFVLSWLTATTAQQATLRTYVTPQVQVDLPTTVGTVITAPLPASITFDASTSDGDTSVFSVIVAVFERPYASATPARSFYQVPVAVQNGGMRATAMPAKMQAPPPGPSLTLGYPVNVSNASKASALATGFITVYLTGGSGIERFVAANAPLSAVGGYSEVRVLGVKASSEVSEKPADGDQAKVLISVTAITSQYTPVTMQYPLTLVAGAGAWSVDSIDPSPLLDYTSAPSAAGGSN